MFTVTIHYMNGTHQLHQYPTFGEARDFYRNRISYSGDRVKRVTCTELGNGPRAIWDAAWNDDSKYAGLA
jgi:hypothetical protein